MKNIVIGGIVGGIILFVWGWLAWTVIPLHETSLRGIENEDRVAETLSANMGTHGVYVLPRLPDDMEELSAEEQQIVTDEWTKKHQKGPIAMIIFNPHGSDPMMAGIMASGLIINVLAAMVVVWLLSRSTAMTASFMARVSYCGMLGILISLCSHLMQWNWLGFPTDYTTGAVVDTIISWLLAGAGIAAVVKSPNSTTTA